MQGPTKWTPKMSKKPILQGFPQQWTQTLSKNLFLQGFSTEMNPTIEQKAYFYRVFHRNEPKKLSKGTP